MSGQLGGYREPGPDDGGSRILGEQGEQEGVEALALVLEAGSEPGLELEARSLGEAERGCVLAGHEHLEPSQPES